MTATVKANNAARGVCVYDPNDNQVCRPKHIHNPSQTTTKHADWGISTTTTTNKNQMRRSRYLCILNNS